MLICEVVLKNNGFGTYLMDKSASLVGRYKLLVQSFINMLTAHLG
jgi:hypothetical protein